MDKFIKLQTYTFIIMLIGMVMIYVYYYTKDKHKYVKSAYHDKLVKKKIHDTDLHYKKQTELSNIIKGTSSGMIRGALMGFLLYGVEGAVTSSIVLGLVNTYMVSIDHYL